MIFKLHIICRDDYSLWMIYNAIEFAKVDLIIREITNLLIDYVNKLSNIFLITQWRNTYVQTFVKTQFAGIKPHIVLCKIVLENQKRNLKTVERTRWAYFINARSYLITCVYILQRIFSFKSYDIDYAT